METLRLVQLVLLWIAAVVATAFPVNYWRQPWRSTSAGRTVMVATVALAYTVDVVLLLRYLHWMPDWARLLIFSSCLLAVIAGAVYKNVALIRAQRRARTKRKEMQRR